MPESLAFQIIHPQPATAAMNTYKKILADALTFTIGI